MMHQLRNSVQLIGRLGQDATLRRFDSGRQLATFSIATSESHQNARGERITDTQWHQVLAWGKLADIAARYLSQGREVMVAGKLTYRQYQDQQGQTRSKTEIHAHSLLLLGPQPDKPQPQKP